MSYFERRFPKALKKLNFNFFFQTQSLLIVKVTIISGLGLVITYETIS